MRSVTNIFILGVFCHAGRAPSSQESQQTKICQAGPAEQGAEKNDEGSTILRNILYIIYFNLHKK